MHCADSSDQEAFARKHGLQVSGDRSGSHGDTVSSVNTSTYDTHDGEFPLPETPTVTDPPLLLVAASSHSVQFRKERMVSVPVCEQLAACLGSCEHSEISTLVANLRLARHVLGRRTIQLSELLGGIVAGHENWVLRLPDDNFRVQQAPANVDARRFMALADSMEDTWAFAGSGKCGPKGWLFLRSDLRGPCDPCPAEQSMHAAGSWTAA